jgi:hypothetical protein
VGSSGRESEGPDFGLGLQRKGLVATLGAVPFAARNLEPLVVPGLAIEDLVLAEVALHLDDEERSLRSVEHYAQRRGGTTSAPRDPSAEDAAPHGAAPAP